MPTVESLIAARILQAIGASAGIVVGRAIIRDLFDRERAASVLGLVATVMVVAPTFGPLIGGLLDTVFRLGGDLHLHRGDLAGGGDLGRVHAAGNPRPQRRRRRTARASAATSARCCAARQFVGYVLRRGVRLVDVLRVPRRRAARHRHADGPHLGRIRRLVRGLLDRLHGRQFRRLAAVDAARHPRADLAGASASRSSASRWPPRSLACAHDWGPAIVFVPQTGHLVRQRPAAARRDRRRDQRAAAGGRHRGRHHRLHADGARRRGRAIRRHAAGGSPTRRCRWRC